MREWTPSIAPGSPGQDYHIVVCNFRDGPAFLETDLYRADFDTIVTNMIVGEYSEPLRVILRAARMFRTRSLSRFCAGWRSKAASCQSGWKISSTATSVRISN